MTVIICITPVTESREPLGRSQTLKNNPDPWDPDLGLWDPDLGPYTTMAPLREFGLRGLLGGPLVIEALSTRSRFKRARSNAKKGALSRGLPNTT